MTSALVFTLIFQGCSSEITTPANNISSVQPTPPPQVIKVTTPFKFSQKISGDGLSEKATNYIQGLTTKQNKRGSKFYLTASVLDKYDTFLFGLKGFYDKRYSDEEIKNSYISEVKNMLGDNVMVMVNIAWLGGYEDSTTQLNFDDKSYEYFFLENEKGDYVKATRADYGDSYNRTVSYISDRVTFTVYFPESEVQKMMKDSKQLFLTFKGLKIVPNEKENRIEFKYPFIEYYQKDFPELVTMIKEMDAYGQ